MKMLHTQFWTWGSGKQQFGDNSALFGFSPWGFSLWGVGLLMCWGEAAASLVSREHDGEPCFVRALIKTQITTFCWLSPVPGGWGRGGWGSTAGTASPSWGQNTLLYEVNLSNQTPVPWSRKSTLHMIEFPIWADFLFNGKPCVGVILSREKWSSQCWWNHHQ